jgi:RiboL-PSP-HEPN
MQRAFDQFKDNMKYVKELDTLFVHLKSTLHLPNDLTDILRAEWVYSVSAMDKLIHELVRIGMIEAFQGRRVRTNKFSSFGVTTTTLTSSLLNAVPPPEYWFEQEIIERHKTLAFQAPEKIADALSLIWDEQHKWQTIAGMIGISQATLITQLRTIINRRNQIVHEADLDLLSGVRNTIDKVDIDSVVDFIERVSEAIFNSVK